jgi:hypothetical protein
MDTNIKSKEYNENNKGEMNLDLLMRIEDVVENNFKMKVRTRNVKITENGVTEDVPNNDNSIYEIIYDKFGNVIQSADNFNQVSFAFPDREIDLNDTWSADIPPTDNMPLAMKANYKLSDLNYEKNGKKYLKIDIKIMLAQNNENIKVKTDGYFLFDNEKGIMYESNLNSDVKMNMKLKVGEEIVEQIVTTKTKTNMILN